MIQALVIFIITYALMIALPKWRWLVALISAAVFLLLGVLPLSVVPVAVNWNVLLMIAGTMGLVALFTESRMPAKLADEIILRVPNEKWAIIALSVFAGIISAFVDNVATVLMVAPLALTLSKKLKTSPVPAIVAIAIASNLEGSATLVGDTTSILLGDHAGMDFFDFFWYEGNPGLFFINQIGLIAATLTLLYRFRRKTQKITAAEKTIVTDYIPTVALLAMVGLLIVASFADLSFLPVWVQDNINGVICFTLMLITVLIQIVRQRKPEILPATFKEIDYETIVLLASLFVVIASIREAGVIQAIADLFYRVGGDNLFLMYSMIVWASVILSAFIDNIPYVATMLPVVTSLAASMAVNPTVLYFGLLVGATLGGNLTPIGASANIAGIGILRKNGYEVSNKAFMSVSVPYTLVAVTSAYILVWLAWGI